MTRSDVLSSRWRAVAAIVLAAVALATAQTATAAVGNPLVGRYLVGDPLAAGAALSPTTLSAIVSDETRAMTAFDATAIGAAEGWADARTHARFLDDAVALSRAVPDAAANAREATTTACGGAGGSASALRRVTGMAAGYELTCRSLVKPGGAPLEIVAFVKGNVLVELVALTAPGFSLRDFEAVAARQYARIPRAGVSRTSVA